MVLGNIKVRVTLLILGLIFGWILGFTFSFVWVVIKGYVLGYGDSGPEWVNTVTTWIQIISVLSCLIASQLVYHYAHKKGRL